MKLAVSLGCDGIEPDQNNPVGNNPGFPITYADEKAWYLEIARQAHALGLSVGMKNGIEIVDSEEAINKFVDAIEGMMGSALVTTEKVKVIQYGTKRIE